MSPDEYRAKWHLPPDYPMVAPNYAANRSEMAKRTGLGRTPKPVVASPVSPTVKRRRRKTAAT